MIAWLAEAQAEVAAAVGRRMSEKPGSVFADAGEAACRGHVRAALAALGEDLRGDRVEALRGAVQALVEELLPRGLRYSDLRFYVLTLRGAVLAALPAGDAAVRQAVDAWFLELVLVCSLRFVVHRDEQIQEQAARDEVQRVGSQLAELKGALAEKSELLERIRQTSTPVAPVVEGILVVPLVGVFDAFRAELLTERLLQAVAQARAQVVILDISGVPVFDAEAAQLIIRLGRAVRLLGTELILVGVAPATARTIVDLGIDLAGLRALGTLQDGLALALQLRRLKISPL